MRNILLKVFLLLFTIGGGVYMLTCFFSQLFRIILKPQVLYRKYYIQVLFFLKLFNLYFRPCFVNFWHLGNYHDVIFVRKFCFKEDVFDNSNSSCSVDVKLCITLCFYCIKVVLFTYILIT